jgi:cysteine-rich repeat protein
MKTSLVLATLVAAGASAVTAGAATFSPKPFQGSDTLFDLTNAAIDPGLLHNQSTGGVTGLGIGTTGDYQGGGSGAGEGAMTAATGATQLTSPMSKMLTATTCSLPADAGNGFTHATGIAIALDAVDIYSATNAGASAACNGTADNTDAGLNYGPSVADAGGPYNNWTDMLALLYGGLDKSTKTLDCNSAKRQALVANWGNLFENGCSNGVTTCTTGTMKFGATSQTLKAAAGTANPPLWHAFRRDDNSGTSDAFASLIGLGTLFNAAGTNLGSDGVSSAALSGFGVSPYCNAMNWDARTSVNNHCIAGANLQFLGPGGVDEGDGVHKLPPPGTWGSNPDPSTANGVIAQATSFQDNDPIRRPCVGRSTFVGVTSSPAEEVCNTDGTLGVVIPIPPVDWIPSTYPTGGIGGAARTAYNEQACDTWQTGDNMAAFECVVGKLTFSTQCANGDHTLAGNCWFPFNTAQNTSLCETDPSFQAPVTVAPPSGDARIYNLFVTDGNLDYSMATITAAKTASYNGSFPFGGAFARIHSQLPLWDTANASTKGQICKNGDATDQIGCLVQADPCSVGYAGDNGKTWGQRVTPVVASGNDALRVANIYPTATTVQNGSYFLWRKVYYNSSAGFDQPGLSNTDWLAVGQYESNETTAVALAGGYGFFAFGHSPNGGANKPFCEDFNEQLIGTRNPTSKCADGGANLNACAFNLNAQQPSSNTAIPSANLGLTAPIPAETDGGTDPTLAKTSTVCGNGIKEAFEDCDNGLSNGASGNGCSATCRLVFP